MKLTRIVIRIVGLGLALTTLYAAGTPAPTAIACDAAPFGKTAPITQDLEPMLLLWGSRSYNTITEFSPTGAVDPGDPPLQFEYGNAMYPSSWPATTFRKAIKADLNGDGRDEIVAVFHDGNSFLVAVYSRLIATPAMGWNDTWTYNAQADFDSIDIAAGDFDGSTDLQQEIALSWNGPTGTHLLVLKGDNLGGIASPDGSYAGRYDLPETLHSPRLAVGDFLLAGRQQMVLAAYVHTPSLAAFKLYLTEFDDGSNPGSVTNALPPVGTDMRAASPFLNNFHGPVSTPYMSFDDGTVIAIDGITALDADAGDLVDTAAAELVLHLLIQGHTSQVARKYLVERLLHFATTRDGAGNITGVELAGGQTSYDSTILVTTAAVGGGIVPESFDATVAEVDGIPGAEIVTAWTSNMPGAQPLVWSVRRAQVRLTPSFQYKNQGTTETFPQVAFINNSHGAIARYTWDFGDNSDPAHTSAPSHVYNNNGSYTVTLKIDGYDGSSKQVSSGIYVTGATDAEPQGQPPAVRTYLIDPAQEFGGYSDKHYAASAFDPTGVRVDTGDMDQDGMREIAIAKKNSTGVDLSVDMHVLKLTTQMGFRQSLYEYAPSIPPGNIRMDMLLGDTNGDSINGVLDGIEGSCKTVHDDVLRSLTWVPPYFSYLQGNASRSARYGTTSDESHTKGTSSSSSITSDTTLTLGFGGEVTVPIVGVVAEATLKYKAGYVHQSNTGAQHSDTQKYTVDEGASTADSNIGTNQEALVRRVQTTSNCYVYRMKTASGAVGNGNMRMCQHEGLPGNEIDTASGAENWNALAEEQLPIEVPAAWVPLQRDWSSVALFRTPSAGSLGGSPAFAPGSGPDKATDGKFTTAASSSAATNPYLEIDLGSVQEITSVRVFPKLDPQWQHGIYQPISFREASRDLAGFRLYVSATPFSGSSVPTSDEVTTVVPGGISTFVQDMDGEQSTQVWSVWTGDRDYGTPLVGRYVRLQKPDSGKLSISEIQVFGATHAEPPAYPEAVCDAFVGDGLFDAYVYNPVAQDMATIELRGDMVWSGASNGGITGVPVGLGFCRNDNFNELANQTPFPPPLLPTPQKNAVVREAEILRNQLVGGGGTGTSVSWNLSEHTGITDGAGYTSSNGFHLGVEFEAKGGAYVKLIGGVAQKVGFSWSSGSQSSVTYGKGFSVGGSVAGFNKPSATQPCGYFPRPYTYQLTDVSNLGAEQSIYVTDYVVQQAPYASAGYWQRGNVPDECFMDITDIIFANGFD